MSRSADIAVGMMDTAYFVGRRELLDFFNNLLDLQLAKIEQTASGAVACQLTEYIFPGSIPMTRVNWEAKSDYEFVNNYKLLQAAFGKQRVQRHVDVNKLIRAKYQDNLEFCQWLKAFYDQSGAVREDYDPIAVRAKGKGGKKYNALLQQTAGKNANKQNSAARTRTVPARPTPASTSSRKKPFVARPTSTTTRTTAASTAPPPRRPHAKPTVTTPKFPLKASENKTPNPAAQNRKVMADAQLMKKNAEMEAKVGELEASVMELEKERDFYFGKLRNVELMLQVQQDKGFEGCDLDFVVGSIFKVLYATAEEDVAVGEDGEIVAETPDTSVDQPDTSVDQPDTSVDQPDTSVDYPETASADLSSALASDISEEELLLVE